jgi:hypothetical protein
VVFLLVGLTGLVMSFSELHYWWCRHLDPPDRRITRALIRGIRYLALSICLILAWLLQWHYQKLPSVILPFVGVTWLVTALSELYYWRSRHRQPQDRRITRALVRGIGELVFSVILILAWLIVAR